MSVTHYDPISAGQISYSNTPYQYWKGHVSDSRLKTIEFSLNNRTFLVEIDKAGNWELQLPLRLEEGTAALKSWCSPRRQPRRCFSFMVAKGRTW